MTSPTAPPRRSGRLERPFGTLHYEVTGSGPALLFAHGLGGNHMSWWQQVAHFAPHYTCVAFAHRGFTPSDAVPGGPDPSDYAGDLAALVDHLDFADVRLVGQSMGGWTVLEYAIARPDKVKALVLSATSGTLDRRGCDPSGGAQYDSWAADAEQAIAAGLAENVHPAMGIEAARTFPALHHLYRGIDEMAGALDKATLRDGLRRTATRMRRPVSCLRLVPMSFTPTMNRPRPAKMVAKTSMMRVSSAFRRAPRTRGTGPPAGCRRRAPR